MHYFRSIYVVRASACVFACEGVIEREREREKLFFYISYVEQWYVVWKKLGQKKKKEEEKNV